MKLIALLTFLLIYVSCTKPTPDEKFRTVLQQRLGRLETEQKQLDERIKKATDAGSIIDLQRQRKLLDSRMERLKAQIEGIEFK